MSILNQKRLVIYPNDVALVLGRSERYGRKLIAQIKKALDKESHQDITIKEFADYKGLDLEEVRRVIL